MREHLVLADQGRGRVLGEHEPRVGPRVRRQERRQAAGERRVEHPVHPALADAGQLREGHGQHVGGERERLPVEVPGRHDLAVADYDGIVHHRAELGFQDPAGETEHVADRAVYLRRAAQAVRVLDGVPAVPVAGQQRGPGEQRAEVGRAVELPRVRPQRLDPLVVGPVGAEQRLHRERTGHVGGGDEHLRVVDREGEQRLHRLGAVDQRQALLGRELQRLDPVLGQHLPGRAALGRVPLAAQPPLPDQGLGQVRELGQVPGRAHGSLAGHDRQQAQIQHLDQPGGEVDPDA